MTKLRHVQLSAFPDLQPDKPIGYILPSVFQGTNADLMAAVAPYYLTGSVCDLTYGEGKWWDRFTPDPFVAHDKYKLDGVDYLIGSALDPDVLNAAVAGHDVVIEAVSPRGDMVGKEEGLVDDL